MEEYREILVKNILDDYMLEKFDYEHEEFYYIHVLDANGNKRIKLSFLDGCFGIKITPNESYSALLTDKLSKFSGEYIFEVLNSEYLKEFRKRDVGFYDEKNIKHYMIFSAQDIVEVLTTTEPIFEKEG